MNRTYLPKPHNPQKVPVNTERVAEYTDSRLRFTHRYHRDNLWVSRFNWGQPGVIGFQSQYV